MIYTKPEVTLLGNAASVIQGSPKNALPNTDPPHQETLASYEPEE